MALRRVTLLTILALAGTPAAAGADQRYAAPGATGDCSSGSPCDIFTAINNAAAMDEVIVTPGDYGAQGAPLVMGLASSAANLYVHGVEGQPHPRIFSDALVVLDITGAGATVRHLELNQIANANNQNAFVFQGSVASDMTVRTAGAGGKACVPLGTAVLANALCVATGQDGRGVFGYRNAVGPAQNLSTLRNVTAIATHGSGIGIDYQSGSGGANVNATVTNSIARGGSGTDIQCTALGGSDTAYVTVDHSNFFFESHPDGTADDVIDGPGNQRFVPVPFAGPGDYHQAASAPTIDKGADDPANGPTDFDGDARILGQATDMGADEFVPAPTATTGDPGATTATSGVVNGTVNPQRVATTYRFDYGTTDAYGSSTPETDAGSGTTDVAAAATLTGLAPATTYHYRVVGSSAGGTTAGADRTFTTAPGPAGTGTAPGGTGGTNGVGGTDTRAPQFDGAIVLGSRVFAAAASGPSAQSAQRRRRRPPVGTTVSFTLDEGARVLFTVQRRLPGRRVGRRCVRPTRRNRSARRCARYVARGTFTVAAVAGQNRFRFTGRTRGRRLAPGRYRLSAVARDAAGNASAARRAAFRIVRRRSG